MSTTTDRPRYTEVSVRFAWKVYWFATEEEANRASGIVRANGDTAYGGYFDGMPLGRDKAFDNEDGFAVKADTTFFQRADA